MDDGNPYAPSLTEGSRGLPASGEKAHARLGQCILLTAIVGIVSSFPLAGLIGLVFRFPVPFAGIMSGPSAFLAAMMAAIVYGVLGGLLVQAFMGCVGGMIAYQAARRNPERMLPLVLICGIASALPGLLLLSMLDWIIGPW